MGGEGHDDAPTRRGLLQSAVGALGGALGVAGASVLSSACRKHRDAITLGLYAALTGPQADFGTSTLQGVRLALERLPGRKLLGKEVYLAVEDTRGDSTEAASAVMRLIHVEGAVGILGEVASSLSLAGGRICQRYRVPMVSPSSTNPAVTELGPYVFRVCFIDPFQGHVMARFARESLHARRVALFIEQGSAYAVGLAEAFRRSFTDQGGVISDSQAYRSGDTHFSAQLGAILASRPEAIFVPGYYTEVALIAREARGQGFRGKLLGGDGWSSSSITRNDDDKLVGDFFSDGFSPDGATTPVARAFAARFREVYHSEPSGLAALGFDAALAMTSAIERARTTDHRALRDAIATTRGLEGATGSITLDAHRDAVKSAVIIEVRENGFRYHSTIDPT